jgi:hypothetical protein
MARVKPPPGLKAHGTQPPKAPLRLHRRATAALRALPDFVVIGAQKGGSSSLYWHLASHPDVMPASKKEVHFFDRNWTRGVRWYRAHFPLEAARLLRNAAGRRVLVGEATPGYVFHPQAAVRAAGTLPAARFVVGLRDPVARAHSHYQMMVRRLQETRPFEAVVAAELREFDALRARLESDPAAYTEDVHRATYLLRGLYLDQLRRWHTHVGRERLLVLVSEEMRADFPGAYARVLDFLGLAPWVPERFAEYGRATREPLDPVLRDELAAFFRPHNEALAAYLGRPLPWA